MNELQLFRFRKLDTLQIARLTNQTEAEVCKAMHDQRQEEHAKSQREKFKPKSKAYAADYYMRVTKEKRQVIRYAGHDPRCHDEWDRA